MSVFKKQGKTLRWYYQFMVRGKMYRGGGYETQEEAIRSEYAEKKYKIALQELNRERWGNYYIKNQGKEGERKTRDRYNITATEYNLFLDRQNNVCAICHKPPTSKALSIDHDHKTKKVRGLLCHRCNTGLSHFDDSPKLLTRAATYLLEGK